MLNLLLMFGATAILFFQNIVPTDAIGRNRLVQQPHNSVATSQRTDHPAHLKPHVSVVGGWNSHHTERNSHEARVEERQEESKVSFMRFG
ncbi:unnamed protein product [Dicrocoelium dendriticum]|nr:unnamed protein product [Dicrocoelium dendriticum]